MTTTALASVETLGASALEQIVAHGNLASLSPADRTSYYLNLCQALGLNHLSRPFQYLQLSGKLTLYATKDASDQLRAKHGVSVKLDDGREVRGVWLVKAHAALPSGRTDESTGAVTIEGLKGDALANALMKTESKAKRRVTLSICGLGSMMDETEIETVKDARRVPTEEAEAMPAWATPKAAPPAAPTPPPKAITIEVTPPAEAPAPAPDTIGREGAESLRRALDEVMGLASDTPEARAAQRKRWGAFLAEVLGRKLGKLSDLEGITRAEAAKIVDALKAMADGEEVRDAS